MSDDRDPDSPNSPSDNHSTTPSGGSAGSSASAGSAGSTGARPDGWDFTQPVDDPSDDSAEALAPGTAGVAGGRGRSGGGRGRGPMTTGDKIRMGVRGVGQTLITAGLVILLFVVYEVWVTNIYADRKQDKVHNELAQTWENGEDPLAASKEKLQLDPGAQVVLPAGQGFANLYIPAFGKDFAKTIVEGIDDASLEKGPGHYPKTAIPGQIGNFAIAGHRVGKGEPFLNLDRLKAGDHLIVQTYDSWYVYTVLGDKATGDPEVPDSTGLAGRSIVAPSAVGVIAPVPNQPDQQPTRALITLTTCHPKYTANERMIIHGELTRTVASQGDAIPQELGGTL
jgi:sortase A